MSPDDQLIDRLRSALHAAVDDVHPPIALLEGIAPARRRLRLPHAGGLVVAFAMASTVAVAVVALVLLGRPQTPGLQSPATTSPPAARAATLPQLRSELAILRRPQRAADRLPAWGLAREQRASCSNCLNLPHVLGAQTRLLTTIRIAHTRGPRSERVYLVLGTITRRWATGLTSGWHQRGRALHGLHLSLVGLAPATSRNPNAAGGAQYPVVDDLLNTLPGAPPAQTLTPRAVLITTTASIGLVPDGVTRVRWELFNAGQHGSVAVYPRVQGNVAIAPSTPAPRYTSLVNEQLLVGATWYAADGHVIASFSDNLAQVDRAYSR